MVTLDYPDAAEVAGDIARPTVQVKYVDTADGGVWVTWRWEHALDKPRIWGIQPQQLAGALAAFDQAVPDARAGESGDDALRRSWAVWGDVARERQVSFALAAALIPHALGMEVNAFLADGRRPHLRIQPSRRLSAVPWQALRVEENARMVHDVDVSALLPASVRNAAGRRPSPWDPASPVVASVDPEVPGRIPGLAPVLRTEEPIVADALAGLGGRLVGGQRQAVSREQLRERLADAGRWLYVGHVTSGAYGLDTRLHLTDGPAARGCAAIVAGVHRPLTAGDIAFGAAASPDEAAARGESGPVLFGGDPDGADACGETGAALFGGHLFDRMSPVNRSEGSELPRTKRRPSDADVLAGDASADSPGEWRIPSRVALIACASGSDASYADPTGLVAALTMRGAEVVTAARWTLPTDVGLEWLAAADLSPHATESSAPFHAFARAIEAVNAAHEHADPVAALSAWQRGEADAWECTGDPAHTPLIWGALTTALS